MHCTICGKENDADAAFCTDCGRQFAEDQKKATGWKKAYWYALLLVPVLALAAGIGYYKFVLPNGVAAVVNGEEIKLSELDDIVTRVKKARHAADPGAAVSGSEEGRLRYAVLSEMITERIALQEARRAGVAVAAAERDAAVARARASSGMDENAFAAYVKARFGSMKSFEETVERNLCITRFLEQTVSRGIQDPAARDAAVRQWLAGASGRATVRIALAEQVPASGCGCCNGGGMKGPAGAAGGGVSAEAARQAALQYWNDRYGGGPVDTKLTDFGCHIQIDIVKGNRVAGSLRYQDGKISEM